MYVSYLNNFILYIVSTAYVNYTHTLLQQRNACYSKQFSFYHHSVGRATISVVFWQIVWKTSYFALCCSVPSVALISGDEVSSFFHTVSLSCLRTASQKRCLVSVLFEWLVESRTVYQMYTLKKGSRTKLPYW